jgi:hypothetical protein
MKKFTDINEGQEFDKKKFEMVVRFRDDVVNAIENILESNPDYKDYLIDGCDKAGIFIPFQNSPIFDDYVVSLEIRNKSHEFKTNF